MIDEHALHVWENEGGPPVPESRLQYSVGLMERHRRDAMQLAGMMVATLTAEQNRVALLADPTLLAELFTLADGWAARLKAIEGKT